MDVSITLEGKHDGPPIEVEAINCTVYEERQTFTDPGSLDIDYEDILVVKADYTSMSQELRDLYREEIDDAIYQAWNDQEPY